MSQQDPLRERAVELIQRESRYQFSAWLRAFLVGVAVGIALATWFLQYLD